MRRGLLASTPETLGGSLSDVAMGNEILCCSQITATPPPTPSSQQFMQNASSGFEFHLQSVILAWHDDMKTRESAQGLRSGALNSAGAFRLYAPRSIDSGEIELIRITRRPPLDRRGLSRAVDPLSFSSPRNGRACLAASRTTSDQPRVDVRPARD